MRALLLAAAVAAAAANGCASWIPGGDRMTVQQGNVLTAANLEELRPGLTRAGVRDLLGTPVLKAPFHRDRWDYLYYDVEAGREVMSPQRLTLFFEDDTLTRILRRYEPPDPATIDEGPEGPPVPPDTRPTGPQGPTPPGPGPRPGPSPMPRG